jgi:hypothetical protein
MSIADQMLVAFCFADDFLQAHPNLAAWRTSHNARPKFSDAEVITIALMQGIFQVATLKQAYLLVKSLFPDAFPHLPQYAPFLSRCIGYCPSWACCCSKPHFEVSDRATPS